MIQKEPELLPLLGFSSVVLARSGAESTCMQCL